MALAPSSNVCVHVPFADCGACGPAAADCGPGQRPRALGDGAQDRGDPPCGHGHLDKVRLVHPTTPEGALTPSETADASTHQSREGRNFISYTHRALCLSSCDRRAYSLQSTIEQNLLQCTHRPLFGLCLVLQRCPIMCHGGLRVCRFSSQPLTTHLLTSLISTLSHAV